MRITDDANRAEFQRLAGVPIAVFSWHTAMINGMTFEDHVPIEDMKHVLKRHPKGVTGLAIAGVPIGSPGMEVSSVKLQAYDVIAFGPSGQRVYCQYVS